MNRINQRLRRVIIFLAAVLAAVGIFGAGMAFGAGSAEPGSQGDPIVTLSYLESRLEQLEGSGRTEGKSSSGADDDSGGTHANPDGGFTRMELLKGQELVLSEGSTLVVYSGNGRITGGSGLINLTSGELFSAGTSAVLYSVFLGVDDESGIKANGSMVVYVSGNFSL